MAGASAKVAELQRLADRNTLGAELDHHVAAVERIMREINGGVYNVVINHNTCFVLVARLFGADE